MVTKMINLLFTQSRYFLFEFMEDDVSKPYLERLKEYSPETYAHSIRVAALSLDLAVENDFPKGEIRKIGHGALLHDIGKLEIPYSTLMKKNYLTAEEMESMKLHPRHAFLEICNLVHSAVAKIVVSHHEYKKNPYPRATWHRFGPNDRRKYDTEAVSLTHLVAAADMYDALANVRIYKKPKTKPEIEAILSAEYRGNKGYIKQIMARHVDTMPMAIPEARQPKLRLRAC